MRTLIDPLINMHPLLYFIPEKSFSYFITIPQQSPFLLFVLGRSVSAQKAHVYFHKVIKTSVTDEGKEQQTHRETKDGGTRGEREKG